MTDTTDTRIQEMIDSMSAEQLDTYVERLCGEIADSEIRIQAEQTRIVGFRQWREMAIQRRAGLSLGVAG